MILTLAMGQCLLIPAHHCHEIPECAIWVWVNNENDTDYQKCFPKSSSSGESISKEGWMSGDNCCMTGPAFEIKYGCPKTCADEKSTKFCKKQKKKGNCKKSKVYKVCMETCGKC